MSENNQTQPQTQTSQSSPKKKTSKAAKIWIPILSFLLVFALCVLGHFLFKSCHKQPEPTPTSDFKVTLHQPSSETSQGWVLYGKRNSATEYSTTEFYVSANEQINIVVSDKAVNEFYEANKDKLNKSNFEMQYIIEVCYGPELYWDTPLEWDEANQRYYTNFPMLFNANIDVSIKAKTNIEQYLYIQDTDNTIWAMDEKTACESTATNIEFVKYNPETFPSGETMLIPRSTFNREVFVGNLVHNIQANFLTGCESFNSKITFNATSSINSLGDAFLINCKNFNQKIDIPESLKYIEGSFLYQCEEFNQPLDLKNVVYLSVGSNDGCFLYKCHKFNSAISMPNVEIIPSWFMNYCISFDQPLTITEKVTAIQEGFMFNCDDMTNIITVNCKEDAFIGRYNSRVCSTFNKEAKCYIHGIRIDGESADQFLEWLSNKPAEENIYRTVKHA